MKITTNADGSHSLEMSDAEARAVYRELRRQFTKKKGKRK